MLTLARQGRYKASSQRVSHNLTIKLKNPNFIKTIKQLSISYIVWVYARYASLIPYPRDHT